MGALRVLLAILAAGLVVAACGGAPTVTMARLYAGEPAKPYAGKTKTEIIACAGTPAGAYQAGTAEIITYHYSGAGPVPAQSSAKPADDKKDDTKKGSLFGGAKKKEDKDFKCTASLTFENGKLTHVTFAPSKAVSPYAVKKDSKTGEETPVPQPEPCVFSLPNCSTVQ
jgi:hypothetical protein